MVSLEFRSLVEIVIWNEKLWSYAMENLWEKEESRSVYVDLFALFPEETPQIPNESTASDLISQKSNQRSVELRNAGNDLFLSGNVFDAIRYYNQSLCFAEVGSENVAVAYVHRSACFYRLKMHEKALRDIELAKKANLPHRMKAKVEKLEAECQRVINCTGKRVNYLPKLSYDADTNYTCMANVIEIVQNDVFGRHIVAKCDIPVGKIVLLEECFAACANIGHDICYTCFRQMENFIPCPNCPDILFCSVECLERNSMHQWECGTIFITNHVKAKLTIDAILVSVETFSGVDNLMKFVDEILCGDDGGSLPTSVYDAKSKFHYFFKLTKTGMFNDHLFVNVYEVYQSILDVSKIADLFDSEEKRRFLMHFSAHIYFVNHANSIGSENVRRVINVFSTINHSCAPNLYTRYTGKVHTCITVRPVKKGDQLFINYLGTQKQSLNERRAELKSKWDFLCGCDKCELSLDTSLDHEKMISDPSYMFVIENSKKITDPAIVIEHCENVLNKYAYKTCSEEIEAVSDVYKSALILEHFKNTL